MSGERKISVLQALLERVQKRAAGPRTNAAHAGVVASPAASPEPMAPTAPAAGPPRALTTSMGMPAEPTAPPAWAPQAPKTEKEPTVQAEADEGPPSAPRLREMLSQEPLADDQDRPDEEVPIKTPPPESGKQHVTPAATSPTELDDEPDEEISITVEESEPPPSVDPQPSIDLYGALAAAAPRDDFGVSGPQPRLALVSEPEIELHTSSMAIMPPVSAPGILAASSAVGAAPSAKSPLGKEPPAPPQDIGLAVSLPSPSATGNASESVVAPPAPIRIMAQPLVGDSGKAPPPVEVWASTYAAPALHGHVANFVGQNASFEPKSFGEWVEASLKLGQETS